MRKLVLLLFANIEIVLADIVLAPSNTAVMKGEEMQMTCLTNNNSRVRKWDIFTTKTEPFTLYSSGQFHKNFTHFGVEVDDNDSGILYTNSTKLSDAGIYKCLSVIDGQDSAQLTVLDSIPTCEESFTSNSVLDGDYIWMRCNVNFRGFWTPTMEWREYNGGEVRSEGRTVTKGVDLIRIQNASVTSNLTIVVNSSKDGYRFACKLFFTKYDGIHIMTATNDPDFTYTWNSSLITLSYSTSESESKALETMESSTSAFIRLPTTRENLESQSSTDWYHISLSLVAALSVFLIIIVVLVVAFCIRFKNKLTAKYALAASVKLEMSTNDGNYEILPYATSDNYDTIDDTIIVNDDFKVSFAPRQGPLPTPGYSSLTETDHTAPGVYSRIDTYETPVDITPLARDAKVSARLENIMEKQVDDIEEKKKKRGSKTPVQSYLELFDAANPETIHEKHIDNSEQMIHEKGKMNLQQGDNQTLVDSYIELFETVVVDDPKECYRSSDCDIPSSYLTVTF